MKVLHALRHVEGWDEFCNEFTPPGSTSAENKRLLLKMAKNGEPRPNQKKHFLGASLSNYTKVYSETYDPIFFKEITKEAPHWFIDSAVENKKQLLKMAKKGESRPHQTKHPLGRVFVAYICKRKSGSYDPIFDKKIRTEAPHWFINTAVENKRLLLEMAKNGEPRPTAVKHILGTPLCCYVGKSHSSYDPVFDKKIRKRAPHWFKK